MAAALHAFGLDERRIGLLIQMATIQTAIARLDQDIGARLQWAAPADKAPALGISPPQVRPTAEPAARIPLVLAEIATIDEALIAGTTSHLDQPSRLAEPTAFPELATQREALLTRYDWLVFRWVQVRDDEPPLAPLLKTRPLPDCALPCLSACTLRGAVDLRCPEEHAERPGGACMLRSADVLSADAQPLRLMTPPDRGT